VDPIQVNQLFQVIVALAVALANYLIVQHGKTLNQRIDELEALLEALTNELRNPPVK
jgi:hypothetical protein